MAITVIVNKPDGEIEALVLEPPAQIQAGPGFVFEFPDLDSSHIEYLVGGDDQDDLTIVLPDGGGEITLLGFQALLAGEEKATIRWGFGIEDGEQVAPDAGQDGGSGGPVSLIDSMIDFLTGLSLESLMNVRVGFRDPDSEESEDSEFEFEFPEQAELLLDAAPPPPTPNNQGDGAPSGRIGPGPAPEDDGDGEGDLSDFGNPALAEAPDDSDAVPHGAPSDRANGQGADDIPKGGGGGNPTGGGGDNPVGDDGGGAPANILDGALITNTQGGGGQSVILTVVSENPVNAYAKAFILDAGGQEGNLMQDVGFDIANGGNLKVALEDAGSNMKAKVTDLDIEGVEIHEQNDDGVSTLRSDADTTAQPNDHFAFTALITPDDPNTGANEGAVIQDVTYSTDGTGSGGNANDDAFGDPGGSLDYLWGGGGADVLTGGGGADFLNGGAGIDQVSGGGGDDILVFDSLDTLLDGGAGTDILRVDSDTDLTGNTAIQLIEVILLTEDAASDANVGIDLTISAQDVLNFTDTNNELYVVGTAGDEVTLDAGWTNGGQASVNGADFAVYTSGAATVNIDVDISVVAA